MAFRSACRRESARHEHERLYLRGPVGAIFDYSTASNLHEARREEVTALLELGAEQPGALVSVPERRPWNIALFRPAREGETFYSMWWALDGEDSPLALVIDCALFA